MFPFCWSNVATKRTTKIGDDDVETQAKASVS